MSHLPDIVFYGLSALLIGSAVAVVTVRNVFYSALGLVAALTFVAGLFVQMGADFLGAAQILVYVGGIVVIMLFVVMLSHQPKDLLQSQVNAQWLMGLFTASAMAASLLRTLKPFAEKASVAVEPTPTSASLGRLLLGEMLLPFEAVSLVLLAALVGAVVFGQDRKQ
jgi:NADH-quinone oxidoreductase subunit J